MSQFKATGINPETKREVDILMGFDSVPGFRPGYFFKVYLQETDKDYKVDSENCILNKGFLNGLSKDELTKLEVEWSVKKYFPINERYWIHL